jgi:hemerythrin superfamily protein
MVIAIGHRETRQTRTKEDPVARARATIDHDTIREWVEERDGCPAHVKGTAADGDPGILRIDYTGFSGTESLEPISWDEFFEAFDANELAFLYQDDDDSRFSKLVSRDSADLDEEEGDGSSRSRSKSSKKSTKSKKSKKASRARGPDAIELLTQQHREVEDAFDKLEAARSDSQKEKMFLKVADLLAAHTKIEETIFYPAAFTEDTEEELREAVEEHLAAKRLIADMLDMEPSDPQFMGKARVLRDIIEHHVEEEEEELFPQVRDADVDDLHVLGARLEQRFKELMEEDPHEEVPNETLAAAPLG